MKKTAFYNPNHRFFLLIVFIAGAAMTLAYAPFNQSWLVFPLLAVLFYGWSRAASNRQVLWQGWLFGLGMQCSGVSWIYNSLHYHGGSPPLLAVALIILLSAYLALYTALAGYIVRRFCKAALYIKLMLLFPASWALMEWLQGIVLTGFAWMQPGYTQIDWPLSGYAPLLGNHGVGLLVAMTAGALLWMLLQPSNWKKALPMLALVWLGGLLLKQVSWTEAVDQPLNVSLVQGNIAQSVKWKREMRAPTLELYRRLSLEQTKADLIIWPETAVPGYLHTMQAYLDNLAAHMQQRDTDLLTGLFIRDHERGRYYNSMININGGEYRKRHLVPLGEYMPLRALTGFFKRWIDIPMSDIAAAENGQPLLRAAGQPLGISICFEDAFARDVLKDLPEATLLVNASNDAWFEDSHEPAQHHAIARMRALETGRTLLRATNTGISSVIGPHGEVLAISPQFETHVLSASVQPMRGSTPYVIWGDYLLLVLVCLVLAGYMWKARSKTS